MLPGEEVGDMMTEVLIALATERYGTDADKVGAVGNVGWVTGDDGSIDGLKLATRRLRLAICRSGRERSRHRGKREAADEAAARRVCMVDACLGWPQWARGLA